MLSTQGRIVIMDSPVYRRGESGRTNGGREREAQFKEKYGFASDNLRSENYLTYARLKELGTQIEHPLEIHHPILWLALDVTTLGFRVVTET